MAIARRRFLQSLAAGASTLACGLMPGSSQAQGQMSSASSPAASDALALHVLQRAAFGPAPADWALIREMGVDGYLTSQLDGTVPPAPMHLQDLMQSLTSLSRHQGEWLALEREVRQASQKEDEDSKKEARQKAQEATVAMAEARLMRALYSPAQLQEVLADFWFNHFNVFSGKGLTRMLVESYEREAIRPHVLGRFRDMLGATARHPAMLFYLDNWMSVANGYEPARRGRKPADAAPGKANGLNENYARELMELHTLGVDGGYTQQDVTELARMLTGWTFNPRDTSAQVYRFQDDRHDHGRKLWLGHEVHDRGQAEGEWALDVLARHPSTARFISFKLAQAFVADQPPKALVQRMADRFLATDGNLKEVMHTLLFSPEFRDPAQFGSKFKTPYQYVLSTVRASQIVITNVTPLVAAMQQQGMPLYGCPTPDGYKNTAEAWLNPDAITRRAAFATSLATGQLPLLKPREMVEEQGLGKRVLAKADEDPKARARRWQSPPLDVGSLKPLLGPGLSERTQSVLAQAAPATQAALLLGSPDFMKR